MESIQLLANGAALLSQTPGLRWVSTAARQSSIISDEGLGFRVRA